MEHIELKNIFYTESDEETSQIKGYDEKHKVINVVIEDLYIRERKRKNEKSSYRSGTICRGNHIPVIE